MSRTRLAPIDIGKGRDSSVGKSAIGASNAEASVGGEGHLGRCARINRTGRRGAARRRRNRCPGRCRRRKVAVEVESHTAVSIPVHPQFEQDSDELCFAHRAIVNGPLDGCSCEDVAQCRAELMVSCDVAENVRKCSPPA